MTVILKPKTPGPGLTYILAIAAYVVSSVAFALYLYIRFDNIPYVIAAASISCVLLLLFTLTWPFDPPVVILNDEGVLDRRLGVGVIRWEDIIDVQMEVHKAFLCLRVKNPEIYIQRLGPAKKQNMQFHQSLGFKMLNIEIKSLDANLLTLFELFRKQIGQN